MREGRASAGGKLPPLQRAAGWGRHDGLRALQAPQAIAELGRVAAGSGDVPVRVQLGEHAAFRAGEVFPGTVVPRGTLVRRFEAPERHVLWAMDGEGSEVTEGGAAGAGEPAPGTPAPGAPARRG